jgi:hypothetical protein
VNLAAYRRPRRSVALPGVKGTTTRMGLVGYAAFWAATGDATTTTATRGKRLMKERMTKSFSLLKQLLAVRSLHSDQRAGNIRRPAAEGNRPLRRAREAVALLS